MQDDPQQTPWQEQQQPHQQEPLPPPQDQQPQAQQWQQAPQWQQPRPQAQWQQPRWQPQWQQPWQQPQQWQQPPQTSTERLERRIQRADNLKMWAILGLVGGHALLVVALLTIVVGIGFCILPFAILAEVGGFICLCLI